MRSCDLRFERPSVDPRFAASLALSAGLVIAVFAALFYMAIQGLETPSYYSHCEKLSSRAARAGPAEKVRLLQEYHEAYCD